MGVLRDALVVGDGPPRLQSSEHAVVDLVDLCEGESAAIEPGTPFPWAPVDFVAAMAFAALGDDDSLGPTLAQTAPRRPSLAKSFAPGPLARLFPRAPRRAVLALSAGLLQIHDFWELSHTAAQEADDLGESGRSAYWHGIAHRREPDAGNASYWFRRVGKHPIFVPLKQAAQDWPRDQEDSLLVSRLIGSGSWNPFAMIDLCTGAPPGSPQEVLARRLQRQEMWLLLEASFEAVA
jgi:hypothetical protein